MSESRSPSSPELHVESLPSPATSHSDSIGPPLSDLAPLSDGGALSDWSASEHMTDDDGDDESFDLVQSRDWSAGDELGSAGGSRSAIPRPTSSAGSTGTSGDEGERMKLSFPDPMGSLLVPDTPSEASGRSREEQGKAEQNDEIGYSFLLDAKPASTFESTAEQGEQNQLLAVESTAWVAGQSSPTANEQTIPPPLPKSRARAITQWVRSTGKATTSSSTSHIEATCNSAATESLSGGNHEGRLNVVFVGGSTQEHDLVIEHLARVPALRRIEVVKASCLKGEDSLVVVFLGQGVSSGDAETFVGGLDAQAKRILLVFHTDEASPSASQASIVSTDSTATVMAPPAARGRESLPADVEVRVVELLGNRMICKDVVEMDRLGESMARPSIGDALRGLLNFELSVAKNENEGKDAQIPSTTADAEKTRAIHAKLDELDLRAQQQQQQRSSTNATTNRHTAAHGGQVGLVRLIFSSAPVFFIFALLLATPSLLKARFAFEDLREANQAAGASVSNEWTSTTPSTTVASTANAVTSTSRPCAKKPLNDPLVTLPAAVTRIGSVDEERPGCSFHQPASCALALARSDSSKSLSVFANRFVGGARSDEASPREPVPGPKSESRHCLSRIPAVLHNRKGPISLFGADEERNPAAMGTGYYRRVRPHAGMLYRPSNKGKSEFKVDVKRSTSWESKFEAINRECRCAQAKKHRRAKSMRTVPESDVNLWDALRTLAEVAQSQSRAFVHHAKKVILPETTRRARRLARIAQKHHRRGLESARMIGKEVGKVKKRTEKEARRWGHKVESVVRKEMRSFPKRSEKMKEGGKVVVEQAEWHFQRATWTVQSLMNGEIGIAENGTIKVRKCDEVRDVKGCRERRKKAREGTHVRARKAEKIKRRKW